MRHRDPRAGFDPGLVGPCSGHTWGLRPSRRFWGSLRRWLGERSLLQDGGACDVVQGAGMGGVVPVPRLPVALGIHPALLRRHRYGTCCRRLAGVRGDRVVIHGRGGLGSPHGPFLLPGDPVGHLERQAGAQGLSPIGNPPGRDRRRRDGPADSGCRHQHVGSDGLGCRPGFRVRLCPDHPPSLYRRHRGVAAGAERSGVDLHSDAGRRDSRFPGVWRTDPGVGRGMAVRCGHGLLRNVWLDPVRGAHVPTRYPGNATVGVQEPGRLH